MFLLIRAWSQTSQNGYDTFTFHNVSINTESAREYLYGSAFFTFHNVSINTVGEKNMRRDYPTLHSTMFLLIHNRKIKSRKGSILYIPQSFY